MVPKQSCGHGSGIPCRQMVASPADGFGVQGELPTFWGCFPSWGSGLQCGLCRSGLSVPPGLSPCERRRAVQVRRCDWTPLHLHCWELQAEAALFAGMQGSVVLCCSSPCCHTSACNTWDGEPCAAVCGMEAGRLWGVGLKSHRSCAVFCCWEGMWSWGCAAVQRDSSGDTAVQQGSSVVVLVCSRAALGSCWCAAGQFWGRRCAAEQLWAHTALQQGCPEEQQKFFAGSCEFTRTETAPWAEVRAAHSSCCTWGSPRRGCAPPARFPPSSSAVTMLCFDRGK